MPEKADPATDFDTLAPLYVQVKQRLFADLQSGTLSEGDFLPPEAELCAAFGVSRITLRRAVSELCEEGLLLRQQGRGTVVARRKVRQTLVTLSGFSDVIEGLGRAARHIVLSHEDEVRSAPLAEALGSPPGARLVRFLRLITMDEQPMTLETLGLDASRYPGVVDPVARGGSFFQALRDRHGVVPAGAERILNVGFATPQERAHLGVAPSQPVYRMAKTIFDPNGDPIAVSRLITPTHLVTYSVRS